MADSDYYTTNTLLKKLFEHYQRQTTIEPVEVQASYPVASGRNLPATISLVVLLDFNQDRLKVISYSEREVSESPQDMMLSVEYS